MKHVTIDRRREYSYLRGYKARRQLSRILYKPAIFYAKESNFRKVRMSATSCLTKDYQNDPLQSCQRKKGNSLGAKGTPTSLQKRVMKVSLKNSEICRGGVRQMTGFLGFAEQVGCQTDWVTHSQNARNVRQFQRKTSTRSSPETPYWIEKEISLAGSQTESIK